MMTTADLAKLSTAAHDRTRPIADRRAMVEGAALAALASGAGVRVTYLGLGACMVAELPTEAEARTAAAWIEANLANTFEAPRVEWDEDCGWLVVAASKS